jgi:hypothetical protein
MSGGPPASILMSTPDTRTNRTDLERTFTRVRVRLGRNEEAIDRQEGEDDGSQRRPQPAVAGAQEDGEEEQGERDVAGWVEVTRTSAASASPSVPDSGPTSSGFPGTQRLSVEAS